MGIQLFIGRRFIYFSGPFLSSEMAEWFSAGYFTMNLLVKRGCDEKFQPLGVYVTWIIIFVSVSQEHRQSVLNS